MEEKDRNNLFEELENYLGTCGAGSQDMPEDEKEEAEYIFNANEVFANRIKPLVEEILRISEEYGIPYFSYMVTGAQTDGEMDVKTWGNLSAPICEIRAFLAIVSMPHEFSHTVLKQADLYAKLLELMDKNNDADSD